MGSMRLNLREAGVRLLEGSLQKSKVGLGCLQKDFKALHDVEQASKVDNATPVSHARPLKVRRRVMSEADPMHDGRTVVGDEGWPAVVPACEELGVLLEGLRQRTSPSTRLEGTGFASDVENQACSVSTVIPPLLLPGNQVQDRGFVPMGSPSRASSELRSYDRFGDLPCVTCTES